MQRFLESVKAILTYRAYVLGLHKVTCSKDPIRHNSIFLEILHDIFCDSYTVLVTTRKWTIWSQAISFEISIIVCSSGVWSYMHISCQTYIYPWDRLFACETGYLPVALCGDTDFKNLFPICYKYGIWQYLVLYVLQLHNNYNLLNRDNNCISSVAQIQNCRVICICKSINNKHFHKVCILHESLIFYITDNTLRFFK